MIMSSMIVAKIIIIFLMIINVMIRMTLHGHVHYAKDTKDVRSDEIDILYIIYIFIYCQ